MELEFIEIKEYLARYMLSLVTHMLSVLPRAFCNNMKGPSVKKVHCFYQCQRLIVL